MHDFLTIKVFNKRLELFSSRQFNPAIGALDGYEDGFFKFVSHGAFVNLETHTLKQGEDDPKLVAALIDGLPLFYVCENEIYSPVSRTINKVVDIDSKFQIFNKKTPDRPSYEISCVNKQEKWWAHTSNGYLGPFKNLTAARQTSVIKLFNKLLIEERNGRRKR